MIRTVLAVAGGLMLALSTTHAQSGSAGTLIVVNKGAASANIIDLASREIVATLPTGDGPHEVAITRDGRTAIVTNYGGRGPGGNTLTVIDVPGLRVARTIDLGDHRRPHGIAVLPGDSHVAVTTEASNHVIVVDFGRGTIVKEIGTAQRGSHMLAMVGNGRTIFTSNIADNTVTELDVTSGQRTRDFPVPAQPEAITVSGSGDAVWVGSNQRGTITVIDPATGESAEVLDGFGWPYRILLTPDGRHAILPDLRRNEVRFIAQGSYEELARLSFADAGPQGVTLSDDGATLFLALSREDRVAIIDVETHEVTGYITTHAQPDGVAYSAITVK